MRCAKMITSDGNGAGVFFFGWQDFVRISTGGIFKWRQDHVYQKFLLTNQ